MITCYFGVPGCGKTTLLTKIAQKELKRIKRCKSPYNHVLTNFYCQGCESTLVSTSRIFSSSTKQTYLLPVTSYTLNPTAWQRLFLPLHSYLFLKFHINGIIQYVFIYPVFSLSIVYLTLSMLLYVLVVPFHCIALLHCTKVPQSVYTFNN